MDSMAFEPSAMKASPDWFKPLCPRCQKGERGHIVDDDKAGMMVYTCGHHSFYTIDPAKA
jgi:hypothetical protein